MATDGGRVRRPDGPSLGAAHQQLREKVRDILRERIVTGELSPGTHIVERAVAEELGVSRIPVRDALHMLMGEGFVTEMPRRGAVVTALSRRDVEELFDVREALEVLSVRLATRHATPDEIEAMRANVEQARTALRSDDRGTLAGCNQAFHDMITAMAHNDLLASMLQPLEGRLHWLLRQNDDPDRLFREHEQLLQAISSGDPDTAVTAALDHVRTSREICHQVLFRAESHGASAQE